MEYEHLTDGEILRRARIETEIQWRRKGSKERRTGFIGIIIDDLWLDLYPSVEYEARKRTRDIGSEDWSEWKEFSFRATSHEEARLIRHRRKKS